MKSVNLFGEGVRGLLNFNLATKKPVGFGVVASRVKTRQCFQYLLIFINLNLLRVSNLFTLNHQK